MLSIIAGLMIAMGGYIYLTLGGIAGALFFAVGLMTILHFDFELFTGKAGLLATKEIRKDDLFCIWMGNFTGCIIGTILTYGTPKAFELAAAATKIVEAKAANHPLQNLILGIGCGILMYIAVKGYKDTKNMVFVFVPVAAFILGGFNHCVADMYYLSLGVVDPYHLFTLIPTTIGNIIGTNLIPLVKKYQSS